MIDSGIKEEFEKEFKNMVELNVKYRQEETKENLEALQEKIDILNDSMATLNIRDLYEGELLKEKYNTMERVIRKVT